MSKQNKNNMGTTKRSTDDLINDAIAQQNDWQENRREYTRGFLKSLNMFAKKSNKNTENQSVEKSQVEAARKRKTGLHAYWFPILCAFVVICIAIWVAFVRTPQPSRVVVVPNLAEPIVQPVKQKKQDIVVPEFDIVRIQNDGNVLIAGRWLENRGVSVMVNNKIIATEQTNEYGEFVYVTMNPWKPGNYTVALVGTEPEVKSADKVFVYISDAGVANSVSLLMTKDGSTLLQAPAMLQDGDLRVSKIDYLNTGRVVVTGDAMPRLRVSLALDGKYLGFARVSDYKHFGLGADIGELETGREYELAVRLHDGDGRTVATVMHRFVMPEMTGDEDTYYTVRRGDCLWIIARNFLRRGILFSIIAERNNITNPDLIFPKQELQIPVGENNK